MNYEQIKWAAGVDVRYWYALYKDACPNCGYVLKDAHPMENLVPHWTGACKKRNGALAEEVMPGKVVEK